MQVEKTNAKSSKVSHQSWVNIVVYEKHTCILYTYSICIYIYIHTQIYCAFGVRLAGPLTIWDIGGVVSCYICYILPLPIDTDYFLGSLSFLVDGEWIIWVTDCTWLAHNQSPVYRGSLQNQWNIIWPQETTNKVLRLSPAVLGRHIYPSKPSIHLFIYPSNLSIYLTTV